MSGTGPMQILQLHEKYGDVVRVSPDQISYISPDAWKDIMGHRKATSEENGKDRIFYKQNFAAPSIVTGGREYHTRFRRLLSHGFSSQSMMEQQPLIRRYINLLISRLHSHCQNGKVALDLVSWYNWTTFDVIGDLAFGEPFGCLENSAYHSWVSIIFDNVKTSSMFNSTLYFPVFAKLLELCIPPRMKAIKQSHQMLVKEKVAKRLESDSDRPDFITKILEKQGDQKVTTDEMEANANDMIIAGSETTATALSAATYLLLRNPESLKRLVEEVRSSFGTDEEITLLSVNNLSYMLAVLDETLRIYPPVPGFMPRRTPRDGATICGTYLPANTALAISQWAMNHSSKNFLLPESFIPECWLGDSRFDGYRKDAFQPFHIGSRNCIGKNLAYAEMRMILARVIYNFDLELAEPSRDWLPESRVHILWEKPLYKFI